MMDSSFVSREEMEETYKLHEREYGLYNGTRFAVLKDEQTVIYERPKGNRDNADPEPDHLVSHVMASGEKLVLVRGEDAKLTKVEAIEVSLGALKHSQTRSNMFTTCLLFQTFPAVG